jgi:hypothetical protein
MVDIDRFSAILEEQAALLPPEVLKNLNLGIGVSEQVKRELRARPGLSVYILGEYHVHRVMGRGIILYYGSFQRAHPQLMENEALLRPEIDRVLRHELTHHLESQAGNRDLELDDARRLAKWNREE